MIQQLNSVDQYCCLFHIVHQHTTVLLSKEATVWTHGLQGVQKSELTEHTRAKGHEDGHGPFTIQQWSPTFAVFRAELR